jgi:hypothetical protein
MSKCDEGDALMGDVNSSVHTMMCGYYKIRKNYIHECQSTMKVLLFLYDVGSSVHTMLCKYCEIIEDLEDSNSKNH